MKKIVIFASGSGSNAEKIILHFKNSNQSNVVAIFTNNPHAKVLDKAVFHQIETCIFNKNQLHDGFVLDKINKIKPDVIVLAGFLLLFPFEIISQYQNKVINIHPALLPEYGGKGMYGINVHKAVLENKERYSGITIHFVNENYDEGEYLFQERVNIKDCKTADQIAQKVLELEHQNLPKIIEQLLEIKN